MPAKNKGETALAPRPSGQVVEQADGTLILVDDVQRALLDPTVKLSVEERDPNEVSAAIVRELIEHGDPLNRPQPWVVSGKDVGTIAFRVQRVEWHNSDITPAGDEDPSGVFASLIGVMTDGRPIVVNCGSSAVMATIYPYWRDGRLPQDVKIVRAEKATKRGYYPLSLVAAEFKEGEQPF
jgi:hypothetical protein